jgi:hypothetical protein
VSPVNYPSKVKEKQTFSSWDFLCWWTCLQEMLKNAL